jgi:hypothetical protein
MSVIVGRALPDVRDGLKPVHRRVLFAMHELSNDWNKAYKKSARIVGDVIGKYHPHGDTAVYDTIVRMAQDFSLRYMLVDGQGNFGSVDGDNAAAMRYTEVRMARIGHELLADIDKETVDFGPNYDGSEQEPLILPARIPNLLINGSSGIAVGMATNIPPHNLGEIVDACLALLENPAIEIEELLRIVPAPDFPTAALIYGVSGVREGYLTGRGRVVMRARTHFEDVDRGARQAIVVDELPYQVNKKTLQEKIAELVNDKRIEGIAHIQDESDKSGMRLVIELKRGEVADVVLNNLYKQTQLQDSFGMNMVALVDGRPKLLNLREMLQSFLAHRREVLIRRNFPDTAYWNPSVVTGDDGTAKVTLKLPDNLTTWRMTARGLTADTRVGQATNDLIATKPLLVRPALPRFLTTGDKLAIQAVVQNNTANAIDATVVLEIVAQDAQAGANPLLKLSADAKQSIQVPANSTAVVRWPPPHPPARRCCASMSMAAGCKTRSSRRCRSSASPHWRRSPALARCRTPPWRRSAPNPQPPTPNPRPTASWIWS